MLGRHVYRVHPVEGRWAVAKEGENGPRADFSAREEAVIEACRLAKTDQPSKAIVDDGDGIILKEHVFGSDVSQELDPTSR